MIQWLEALLSCGLGFFCRKNCGGSLRPGLRGAVIARFVPANGVAAVPALRDAMVNVEAKS